MFIKISVKLYNFNMWDYVYILKLHFILKNVHFIYLYIYLNAKYAILFELKNDLIKKKIFCLIFICEVQF